ncbi:hypothetical protein BJX99DRAFT_49536 [Aspergillus californicus]
MKPFVRSRDASRLEALLLSSSSELDRDSAYTFSAIVPMISLVSAIVHCLPINHPRVETGRRRKGRRGIQDPSTLLPDSELA